MNSLLSIKNMTVSYHGIEAVKEISLDVPQGQIVTLVGANGAGKSTILKTIAGLIKPKTASILFREQEIAGQAANTIVKAGITLVPEGRRVFPSLTVQENLRIGAYLRKGRLEQDFDHVYSLFPRLKERKWQMAGTLSGGEQQMLAVGRALMSRPKLIMMDEPSLGLAPLVIKSLFDMIQTINRHGITVLLVEQNAVMALQAAHMAYVLENGRVVKQGTGKELLADDSIWEAYLGKKKKG